MTERVVHLTAFTHAIVAGHTDLFDPTVRLAYEAGAWVSDLLTAVDIARSLAAVPKKVAARAYTAAHDWQWMAARREDRQREPVKQGV